MKEGNLERLSLWKYKKYVPVVVLVLFSCMLFQNGVKDFSAASGQDYAISLGDYIADFWKGTLPYTMTGEQTPFNIPGIWSFYLMYYFAVIGKQISEMFQIREYQYAVRYVTRGRWYRRQMCKIGVETLAYLAVTYITFLIYAICSGSPVGMPDRMLQAEMNGLDMTGFQKTELLAAVTVVPVLAMLALAYVQYLVSVTVNGIVGLIVPVVILVSSVFYMSPLLPGNYLMLMLYGELSKGLICVRNGMVVCLVIAAGAVLFGRRIIQKKDLR